MNKDWPIYFKDKLVIWDINSDVWVVCLWTPVSIITDKLDKQNFSIAWQLYSKEWINYILRNILAHPRIKHIVICWEDRVWSWKALINLIDKWVDENNNVLDTDNCSIHKEISKEFIDIFRNHIKIHDLTWVFDSEIINSKIKELNLSWNELWYEWNIFPEAKIEFDWVMPTDQSVFKIRKRYAWQVWLEIIKKILKFWVIRESFHGNNCKELFNIAAVITDEDPDDFKLFPYFQITKEDIDNYIPKMMTWYKWTADYTYWERIWNFPEIEGKDYKYNQIEDVIIDYLTRYPTDRAACATIFWIQDHTAKSSPCMTFLQATNVENKLDLTVYFRSHDIFGWWLLNAFWLRKLQKHIAYKLGWPVWNLTIYSNCAHIYDNNWWIAQDIINKYWNTLEKLDCELDPRGYFNIEVDWDEIMAKHSSPNGKFLQEFRQNWKEERATIKLYNQLVLADVVSQINHAYDIGAEIQKAELAIKLNLKYTQDKPLI